MPPGTTPFGLRTALRTGRTAATKALDAIVAAGGAALAANLAPAGALDKAKTGPSGAWGAGGWARVELQNQGLNPVDDVDHVRNWPDAQKDLARIAVLDAINNGRLVTFRWELHHGNTEETDIRVLTGPAPGEVTITFLSPWRAVRARGMNDLHVDVETFPDSH